MKNKDIREYAKEKNIKLWRIADKLKVADTSFSRMLRKELSDKMKGNIYTIIDELEKEKED